MTGLNPRRILRTAWHLVLAVVALAYLLAVRSALWVFTLILMVYFSVNDPGLSSRILTLVNGAIPGSITAERIHWEPFRSRIHVLGVVISRPGDVPVIQAARVTTDMRLGALLGHVFVGGEDDPLPLIFDRTLIRDGMVDLEFRDEGLLLVLAFDDPDAPPSDDPSPVKLQMHDIRIEDTTVRLDFDGDWGLLVHAVDLDGEVRFMDEITTVGARGLTAAMVELTGSLPFPDSIAFLSRPVRDFRASRFFLQGNAFEIVDAAGRTERFDFRLNGAMDYTPDRPLSLDSVAVLHVPDPTVLGEITAGSVTGALDAAVEAKGPLVAANLAVSVKSPRVEVLGVPFDDVDGAVRLNLANPTLVRVGRMGCWFHAGRIDAEDVLVHALPSPGELVRIGGLACVEGADPAEAARGFGDYDIESVSPLLAGAMTGCVGLRDLRVTDDDVTMSLSLDVATGCETDPRVGLGGAWSVEGDLALDLGGARTRGLTVLSGQDRVALSGGLRWTPELSFDLLAEAWSPGIARHLEAQGVPEVDGDLAVHRLSLRGTLDAPEVDLEASVKDLRTSAADADAVLVHRMSLRGLLEAPEVELVATVEQLRTPFLDLAQVDLDAHLRDGDLVLRRLAWADALTDGAIAGDVARLIGPGPRILNSPWRVGLEAIAPIRLPLELLAPDEGILGLVRLDNIYVDGRVGTQVHHLLRNLRVAGEGVVTDLSTPAGGARRAALQFSVETRRERGAGDPHVGASLQLQGEGVDVGGIAMKGVDASIAVEGIPLRFDLAALSQIRGDVAVEARGLSKDFLAFRDLAVSLHYPEGGDAILAGKVQVTRGVGARLEGRMARKDLAGHARLIFDRMPLRSVPMPKALRAELDIVREALITAKVRLDWPALGPLLELPFQKILPRLTMQGDLKVQKLETLPEPVREVSAKLTLKGGRLDLPELRVTLASGHGLRAAARLDLDQMTGEGEVAWSPLDLRSLKTMAALDLPVQARVGGRVRFEGDLTRPKVRGALSLDRLQAAGIFLGDADLDFSGAIGDTIRVTSDRFFEGFSLDGVKIRFDDLEPVWIEGVLGFTDLTLARILPDAELPVAVTATGRAAVTVNTRSSTMVDATVHIGDAGLAVELPALDRLLMAKDAEEAWESTSEPGQDATTSFRLVNRGAVDFTATERGAATTCLRLKTPIGEISLAGEVDLRHGYSLDIGGAVSLQKLDFLSPYLAKLHGQVQVGGKDACAPQVEGFRITGALDAPEAAGRISLAGIELLARGYPREIRIRTGEMEVSGRLDTGDLAIRIPEASRVEARHDEGTFSMWGDVDLAAWLPDRVELDATGSNIFISVPRQYRINMNPTLHLSLLHPFDEDAASGLLRGRVDVTEGKYYRNFDRLLGSFATAFSRSQERYSRPITEVIPFLKTVNLELVIRSTDFTVASRFPFGETDMEVDLDLQARGTLDDLELHDRLTLIPGGMITYKVVKREFEVQSGYADFTGDPGKPAVDVKAVTTINRIPTESGGYVSQTEKIWGRDVNITVHVYGTYPDLRFDLSSDSGEYDQTDLQTLLLLGMTRRDLENQGMGDGSTVSINLLTDDVARAVSNLLLSPFLDAVSLGFTQEGGIQAETLTKVGRAMHLTTKVAQEADLQEYTAGFRFMLSDRLFLEGRMKMKQDSDETNQNYEGRLLYRIPLE